MIFADEEHKSFYIQNVQRTKSQKDPYRKALFYTLGITGITRDCIEHIYDFNKNQIILKALNAAWQTGTTMRITRLAFNLYNGYLGETEEEGYKFTPYYLFDTGLLPFMLEAIKVRYAEYAT